MNSIDSINVISVLLIAILLIPVAAGFIEPFSKERVRRSFGSLIENVEFLAGLLLSLYVTRRVFFEDTTGVFKVIYDWIPDEFKAFLFGRDILVYLLVVPVVLLAVLIILRFITAPLAKFVMEPLAEGIYRGVNALPGVFRRLTGALWQLPRAVFLVLVFGLLLNFTSYYFTNPLLARWMNESLPYQILYDSALYPILNSNVAKKIPVLVNDSFARTVDSVLPEVGSTAGEITGKLAEKLSGRFTVIEYFNGVTLDEAILSNAEIDEMAWDIIGDEDDDSEKAYSIYKWISKNIEYDYDKAIQVSTDPRGVSSGSIPVFYSRKGICFDYSSLYISMCRAVGLKVRLVTGLGYSGISWGDHAWNQVYYSDEDRWINVDATFGASGNYFDKPDFNVDHKYPEVQGEW